MNTRTFALPMLGLLLAASSLAGSTSPASAEQQQGPQYGQDRGGYGQNRDDRGRGTWDTPPREFNEIQRRGYQDGIEGARKDVENRRQPDVNNRDEYRRPQNVPRRMQRAYREAFSRGYQQAMSHLMRRDDRRDDNRDRR